MVSLDKVGASLTGARVSKTIGGASMTSGGSVTAEASSSAVENPCQIFDDEIMSPIESLKFEYCCDCHTFSLLTSSKSENRSSVSVATDNICTASSSVA